MKSSYYSFPNPEPIAVGEVQVVDIARHLSFNRGAIVKYVSRAGRKSVDTELQDLEKALDHLQDEIASLKAQKAAEGDAATELRVKLFGIDQEGRPVTKRPDGTIVQGWSDQK